MKMIVFFLSVSLLVMTSCNSNENSIPDEKEIHSMLQGRWKIMESAGTQRSSRFEFAGDRFTWRGRDLLTGNIEIDGNLLWLKIDNGESMPVLIYRIENNFIEIKPFGKGISTNEIQKFNESCENLKGKLRELYGTSKKDRSAFMAQMIEEDANPNLQDQGLEGLCKELVMSVLGEPSTYSKE